MTINEKPGYYNLVTPLPEEILKPSQCNYIKVLYLLKKFTVLYSTSKKLEYKTS
jgi:hypothetical protein